MKIEIQDYKPKHAAKFTAYYDACRKDYFLRDGQGGWSSVNETSLKRHMRAAGLKTEAKDGAFVSEIDAELIDLQTERAVQYAGPLAGQKSGFYEICGNRVLVTQSPKLPIFHAGEWPTLERLLSDLFRDPEHNQRDYVLGWLQIALQGMTTENRRPGQALAIAGPRGCGKSLLQNLITVLLGGRSAKPYQFMTGQTPFNADLFSAEHLMVEDEFASTDLRARRNFGAQIKDLTVNRTVNCHAKNRQAVSLTPFWRLSITLNDEAENLLILPPLDESLADKLIILRAASPPPNRPVLDADEYSAFWEQLVSELPAFGHFLLNTYSIPEELRSTRFGIAHWHHPALVASIETLAPEFRLLDLIDQTIFTDKFPAAWTGSANELQRILFASQIGHEAKNLLSWPTACAVYLGRLATKTDSRVTHTRDAQARLWTIAPPMTE